MALYIPHSIFHLARLLYVRPETSGPYYVIYKSPINLRILFSRSLYTGLTQIILMEASHGFPQALQREFLENTDISSTAAVILGYNLLGMSTTICNYVICAHK